MARPLVDKAGRVGRWCRTSTVPLLVLPAALGAEVYAFGSALEPDSTYFTSGVALFPSPVGTVIGTVGGYRGLALVNAVAAAAIILLVALIARELGNRPLVAQGIALLLAPAGWTKEWGMDSPALAILLGATLLYLKGRYPLALAGVFLAAATHLAALPLAVAAIVACSPRRRGLLIGGVLVCAGASLALVTPYRAGFNILSEPQALAEGARELFDACWPLLLLVPIATIVPRGRPSRSRRGDRGDRGRRDTGNGQPGRSDPICRSMLLRRGGNAPVPSPPGDSAPLRRAKRLDHAITVRPASRHELPVRSQAESYRESSSPDGPIPQIEGRLSLIDPPIGGRTTGCSFRW